MKLDHKFTHEEKEFEITDVHSWNDHPMLRGFNKGGIGFEWRSGSDEGNAYLVLRENNEIEVSYNGTEMGTEFTMKGLMCLMNSLCDQGA